MVQIKTVDIIIFSYTINKKLGSAYQMARIYVRLIHPMFLELNLSIHRMNNLRCQFNLRENMFSLHFRKNWIHWMK